MLLRTVDAHVGGQAVRLVVDGFPAPHGRDMLEKRDWAEQHADHLRRTLMLEPRGHADMSGVLLTEPVLPDAHAGLLFMDGATFGAMSGHGVVGATAIALERRLLVTGAHDGIVSYDTPAGRVRVNTNTRPFSFSNVPSFVLHAGLSVALGARPVPADVAFGGEFYAVVDGETAGLGTSRSHLADLRRAGELIAQAIEETHVVRHPLDGRLGGVAGTIFTGPAADGADLRTVVVTRGGADRSPSGTGMSAVMAVLHAMGILTEAAPLVCESLNGARFEGVVARRTLVGDRAAILPEIRMSAWITGEHTFVVDPGDPFREGFQL